MTSAHTTLRELLAHLARAQRAFDAGRLEDAEGAVEAALAIDPHNVQAADLRQQMTKQGRPAAPRGSDATPGTSSANGGGTPRPAAAAPATRALPAGWSRFEERVRQRRADLAAAEAEQAFGRGDSEGARASLAELDEASPDDPRRTGIVAEFEAPASEPALAVAASRAPQPPGTWPPYDREEVERALEQASLRPWPTDPQGRSATRLSGGRRRWARRVVLSAAVAAIALLGLRLFTADTADLRAVPERTDAQLTRPNSAAPPEPRAAEVITPETAPADAALSIPADQSLGPSRQTGTAGSEETDRSAATPDRREETATTAEESVRSPQPAQTARVPEPSAALAMNPADTGLAGPPPAPLDAPLQSPIEVPDTRLSGTRPGGEQVAHLVPPVPAPPAAAAAPVAAGAVETGTVRRVLDGYANAFTALDAKATQRVWPGVDVQGLRRAFDQLNAQTVTFNRCDVNASDETAEAVCVGRATWVPKVGDRSPKTEPRTWRFALGRDRGEWVIDRVHVQR